jgi:fimbrial chaperone protein
MRYYALAFGLFSLLAAQQAHANLLISPVKIEFTERDRMQEITLVNNGTETRSYRVEWEEKKALPQGGYQILTAEEVKTFPIASSMLRFSPRQVTLKPRERQTVKLMLRRQANLKNGSYRSNLKFVALPPIQKIDAPAEGMSIRIDPLMSYSLPVTVHQGPLNYQVQIASTDFVFNAKKQQGDIKVVMNRSGSSAVRVNVIAYWTPAGEAERIIARTNDISLFPEVSSRTTNLAWATDKFTNKAGKLRIAVEGVKLLNGTVLAEKTQSFSSIKTVSQ